MSVTGVTSNPSMSYQVNEATKPTKKEVKPKTTNTGTTADAGNTSKKATVPSGLAKQIDISA